MKAMVVRVHRIRIGLRRRLDAPPEIINHFLMKSIDERRDKLKIRRVIDGRRLEVLHLPADVMEHSMVEKTGPIGPLTGAKNDPAWFSWVRGPL